MKREAIYTQEVNDMLPLTLSLANVASKMMTTIVKGRLTA